MSCVRRVVPIPTMRGAFTDIDCFDVLVFGMPPEHDHAMLGLRFQGSNPARQCRSRSILGHRRSRSILGRYPTRTSPRSLSGPIAVESGSAAGATSFRFAPDARAPSRHAQRGRGPLGSTTSWVDHEGSIGHERFRLEASRPIRPVHRHASRRRPTSGNTGHDRAADRRCGAGGGPEGHGIASVGGVPARDPPPAVGSGRRHRACAVQRSAISDRFGTTARRTTSTSFHSAEPAFRAPACCGRCVTWSGGPVCRPGCGRARTHARTRNTPGARGNDDRAFHPRTGRRHGAP